MRLGEIINDAILRKKKKAPKIKLQGTSISRGLGNEREPVKGDLER